MSACSSQRNARERPRYRRRPIKSRREDHGMSEVMRDEVLAALSTSSIPTRPGHRHASAWSRACRCATAMSLSRIEVERARAAAARSRCARQPRKRSRRSPGVLSVTAVLTAEKPAQRRPRLRAAGAARRHAGAARSRAWTRCAARKSRRPRRQAHHRRRLGQGRRRQIDHRGQSRPRARSARPQGRRARRRHLRPLDAAHARHLGQAASRATARRSSRWSNHGSNACRWASSSPRTRR